MEKVLQEFRIIETDDGFRIEIKGDKEQLRDWVMNLNPQQWAEHDSEGHEHGPGRIPPFGPPWMRRAGPRFWMRFAPPGWGPTWDDEEIDDDEDEAWAKRRRHGRGPGHGHGRGRHEHGEHAHDEDTAQA